MIAKDMANSGDFPVTRRTGPHGGPEWIRLAENWKARTRANYPSFGLAGRATR